jgi:D-apiose dehydrogenase
MDTRSTIRVKRLGQPAFELDYPRERKNFAGDCVFSLQRHFVDCLLSGEEFETNGLDYLNNVRIVEAAYESSRTGGPVRLT